MPHTRKDSGRAQLNRRKLIAAASIAGLGAVLVAETSRASPLLFDQMSDDVKLRHLLRRAGFGASGAELGQYRALGLAGSVDRLVNFEQVDNSALDAKLQALSLDLSTRKDLERWWYLRMISTQRPLEEKMTLFWHGLLTSAISKVKKADYMLGQNNFFRANALGAFPDILKGVSRDPAMMIWLDTVSNNKGHANENYARELMELFSLGVGNYTEQDVREAARAFTGWTIRDGSYFFNARQHDDGQKTFLGQTGSFNGDDVIDIIVRQPASAAFIVRKLFSFFVYPDPADDTLRPFIDAYTKSGYSIRAVVRALLTSDAFYSPQAYRAIVKSPAELIAGTLRSLGADVDGRGLPAAALQMGQELFNPPNVAGWPGGPAWLSSGTWLARLNFANAVAARGRGGPAASSSDSSGGQSPAPSADPSAATQAPASLSPSSVQDVVSLLLDGQISAAQRQVLVDYVTPPPGGATASWAEERARGLLYLALAMPEYHLS